MKKSKTNRKLDGVLGGIAEYCNVDPTLLRLGYFGASIIMSNAENNSETDNSENKE